MIITVTLNAAIDKTLAVPNFRLGRRHRTVEQTTLPGGKGVNVARALKAGQDEAEVALVPGPNDILFMVTQGAGDYALDVEAEVRGTTKVVQIPPR